MAVGKQLHGNLTPAHADGCAAQCFEGVQRGSLIILSVHPRPQAATPVLWPGFVAHLFGRGPVLRTCNRVMAHRPTGSTQTDRIRLPYAARRLSLSRWGQSPVSAKEERVSRLPSARAKRIRRASRPGSVGFPDSASCGYPRTHEGFRPCHKAYGYTGGSYSRRSTAALAPWPRCHR